ncbi:hypothetical protein NY78_4410 [Desulfovibrio sp. TomC]|nr:hypothetical protein NY78_4410 [Desulfovibrio sp. TomC]
MHFHGQTLVAVHLRRKLVGHLFLSCPPEQSLGGIAAF